MLGRSALVGKHVLVAFRESANKIVSILVEAGSDEGDRQLALSWIWLAREGSSFSDKGLVEY